MSCVRSFPSLDASTLITISSSVSKTELEYLDGVTSAVQTQLDGKALTSHNHAAGDITSGTFADARIASSNVTQHEGDLSITTSQISDLSPTVFRQGHTWGIAGDVVVPSGDDNFICPFYVSLAAGQSIALASIRHRINSGTSATIKLQKNGVDITGYTGISVTTTSTTTNASDVSLSDNDEIAMIVTGASGLPKNMSVTIFLDHTV